MMSGRDARGHSYTGWKIGADHGAENGAQAFVEESLFHDVTIAQPHR